MNRVWVRLVPPATLLILALAFRPTEWGPDALNFSRYARRMTEGEYTPTGNPAAHRVGLVGPVALCYLLWGETEASAWLFSLLCGVGLVLVGQSIPAGRRAGLIAGLLVATTPIVVTYSMRLMGDIPVALACALALKWARGGRLVWAGLALGIGFWIKETTGLAAIFLFGWLWRREPRDWRGLGVFAAAAGAPVVAGFAALWLYAGDPWVGAEALHRSTLTFLEGWRPGDPPSLRAWRWTLEYPAAVLTNAAGEFSMMGPLAWAFIACVAARWRSSGPWRFFAAGTAVMAALLVWLPMSLAPPTPMFMPLPRYWSIVLVPMAVVVAEAKPRVAVVAVLLVAGLVPVATRSAVSRARQVERHEVYRMLRDRNLESVHFALPEYIERAGDYPGFGEIRTVVKPVSEARPGAAILQVVKGDAPFPDFPGWSVAWEREFKIPPPGRDQLMGRPGTRVRWRLLAPP